MCNLCVQSVCRSTYKQLGLLTYFTTGVQESRAWTIQEGMTAPQAAGVIHTGAGGGAAVVLVVVGRTAPWSTLPAPLQQQPGGPLTS